MALHDGHRERLRGQFLADGLDGFSDIQVLELLLFYSIARRDTNPIAHRLLDHFGSLAQVLEASPEELCRVEGVGENTAAYLHMIPQVCRRYQLDRTSNARILPTLESCARYLQPFFFGQSAETVYLLCLDAKCKVLCCKKISQGSVNAVDLPVRRIVETALSSKAASVLLAHNHPGGMAIPSNEDISATLRAADALRAVDVQLADHLIICDDDYVSLMQSGYMTADMGECGKDG